MQNVTTALPEPRTEAEYEAAVKQMLADMEHMQQKLNDNRTEIERLQAETHAILATLAMPT
jgi:hypothetical protein